MRHVEHWNPILYAFSFPIIVIELTQSSCHDRLLGRHLRSEQYYPRLGFEYLFTDEGEEGMLAGHCELHSRRFVYLDSVHVAEVG